MLTMMPSLWFPTCTQCCYIASTDHHIHSFMRSHAPTPISSMNLLCSTGITRDPQTNTWKHMLLLSYQSLGVVYGHLSLGPLFVFRSVSPDDVESEEMVYGLLSFVFWTLTLISLVKYVNIILWVDDNGEGGTFALYSLLCKYNKVSLLPSNHVINDEFLSYEEGSFRRNMEPEPKRTIEKNNTSHYLLLIMALLASCMVISNGVLVPAISVFSASMDLNGSLAAIFFKSSRRREGFENDMSIPTACGILICLFVLQHYGTHKLSFLFAPIIIVWLLFISGIGIYNIFDWNMDVIRAISPKYLYKYMRNLRMKSWRPLGGALLCVAGSEAIFADLGHFSKKSIKMAFCLLVYPSLVLCYMGQAAFISKNLNPPGESYYPSWIISTCGLKHESPGSLRHFFAWFSVLASAVGSQATITATFSIINQCQALGCFPKVKVVHTSKNIYGQVYIPVINWTLMSLCLLFTIAFKDIVCIANATGLATIIGMLITTSFMSLIIGLHWGRLWISACFLVLFGSIECIYIVACVLNFQKGAGFLVSFVGVILIIMLSWHYGTIKKYEFDVHNKVSIEWFTTLGSGLGIARVLGIALVPTDIVMGIPAFFSHLITNIPAFHQVLIFVSFKSVPLPYVQPSEQYLIGRLGPKEYRVYRCIVRYGYRDSIRDIIDFEDNIIHSIMEFVSLDDDISESFALSQDNTIVTGNLEKNYGLITMASPDQNFNSADVMDSELPKDIIDPLRIGQPSVKRRSSRFLLPPESPRISSSAREELEELIDAREHGTTYILGQPHFCVRRGSNFLRRLLIMIYTFLDRNIREDSMPMSIQQSAYIEASMVYSI